MASLLWQLSHGPFWQPAVDIYVLENFWLVKMELAGVDYQDLDVRIEGQKLVVRGRRRDEQATHTCQPYRMEIAYNQFERIVELPDLHNDDHIKLDYQHGMLLIYIGRKS